MLVFPTGSPSSQNFPQKIMLFVQACQILSPNFEFVLKSNHYGTLLKMIFANFRKFSGGSGVPPPRRTRYEAGHNLEHPENLSQ